MDKPTGDNQYQAYLLRLWTEGAEAGWRASLEAVDDGRQRHFASLAALAAYLGDVTGDERTGGPSGGKGK